MSSALFSKFFFVWHLLVGLILLTAAGAGTFFWLQEEGPVPAKGSTMLTLRGTVPAGTELKIVSVYMAGNPECSTPIFMHPAGASAYRRQIFTEIPDTTDGRWQITIPDSLGGRCDFQLFTVELTRGVQWTHQRRVNIRNQDDTYREEYEDLPPAKVYHRLFTLFPWASSSPDAPAVDAVSLLCTYLDLRKAASSPAQQVQCRPVGTDVGWKYDSMIGAQFSSKRSDGDDTVEINIDFDNRPEDGHAGEYK